MFSQRFLCAQAELNTEDCTMSQWKKMIGFIDFARLNSRVKLYAISLHQINIDLVGKPLSGRIFLQLKINSIFPNLWYFFIKLLSVGIGPTSNCNNIAKYESL